MLFKRKKKKEKAEDQVGISQVSELGVSLAELFSEIFQAREDKKVSFPEGIAIGMDAIRVAKALKNWDEIKKEIQDLDDQERNELIELINENFDLPNDDAEQKVEGIIAMLNGLSQLIS